jgi:hypothetical protein
MNLMPLSALINLIKRLWAQLFEDRSPKLPRIDARDKKQRDVAAYLRQQHLSGVDADDDASVVLEVEQARLALFASAGVIAFEVTQLLASERDVCVTPLYWSLALLCGSICGAWLALVASEHVRRSRVDRRYTIYHQELAVYVGLEPTEKPDRSATDDIYDKELSKEKRWRLRLRFFRYLVALVTAAGIGAGVLAAVGTAEPNRCHFEMLKAKS